MVAVKGHRDVDVVRRLSYDGGCTWSELGPAAESGRATAYETIRFVPLPLAALRAAK